MGEAYFSDVVVVEVGLSNVAVVEFIFDDEVVVVVLIEVVDVVAVTGQ